MRPKDDERQMQQEMKLWATTLVVPVESISFGSVLDLNTSVTVTVIPIGYPHPFYYCHKLHEPIYHLQ